MSAQDKNFTHLEKLLDQIEVVINDATKSDIRSELRRSVNACFESEKSDAYRQGYEQGFLTSYRAYENALITKAKGGES